VMARRPASKALSPIRDVAAEEEAKFLKMNEIARLSAYLAREIENLSGTLISTLGVPIERASPIWRGLRALCAVRVLLRTGLRRFEFCALTCADFEDGAEPRLWTVGKGARRHYVPLPAQATEAIREWMNFKHGVGESADPGAPLFCGREGEFMSFELLRQDWARVLRDAGLPTYRLHASRHSAGLIVLAATGDLHKVARFLRHEGTSVTQRVYAHVDAGELRRELSSVRIWP